MEMRRLLPYGFALIYALLPVFPAFIALTSVAFPGITVVPMPVAFAALAAIGVLAVYAATMLLRYPLRGSQPLLLPLLAWIVCATISTLAGFDPPHGLFFLGLSAMGILWHCALMRFYAERGVPLAIFWSYLATGTLAAAVAIAMVASRTPASLYALAHGRATGTFVLPGELAGYLVALLPIAVTLTRLAPSAALRALSWAATAVGLVALALTYSRAGWIGAAAAAAFLMLTQARRLRASVVAAAAVSAVAAVAVLLLFNSHHDPSEDYTRIAIWQAAAAIVDRFPLTGVGPFDFPRLYALVHVPDADATAFHAHSLYLTLFAELGVLGLTAFLWNLWTFARELRARVAHAPPAAAAIALAVAAGLVGVAVQGLIDTVSIVIFGLWMPAMGLALAAARSDWPNAEREAA
ncbi:MAG TPA: O-antigen ligase family protein [Candidatus Tumulicola sp.]|jgi:O-antigen ligase